jgi:hypothetical protein
MATSSRLFSGSTLCAIAFLSAIWAGCGGQTGDDGLSDLGGGGETAAGGAAGAGDAGAGGDAAGGDSQGGSAQGGATHGGTTQGGSAQGGSSVAGSGGDTGSAGSDPGTDPLFSDPPTCSSNAKWTKGNNGSSSMHPGGTCIQCHSTSFGAPKFLFAGTVYATGHDPNDCNGVNGKTTAAQVIVTDANGQEYSAAVNKAGNFLGYPVAGKTFKAPYTARVVSGGKERAMSGHQTSGDCNSCHTDSGAQGAPGRIALPQ